MTTDSPDLRTLAAEAILAADPRLLDLYSDDRALYLGWADAVLSAVLPAHRAMVLEEAADTLTAVDLGPSRNPGWMFADDPVALVRRLAATAPPVPPASTVEPENGPAVPDARAVPIEDLIEEISAADPEFRAAVERTERGRLVPDGAEAVEQWGSRMTWPNGDVDTWQDTKCVVESRVQWHQEGRSRSGVMAELVRRTVITTPWVAVQPGPAQEETNGQH